MTVLSEWIEAMISAGNLLSGDRLPPERQRAADLKVSWSRPGGYSSGWVAVSLHVRRGIHGRNRPVYRTRSYPSLAGAIHTRVQVGRV